MSPDPSQTPEDRPPHRARPEPDVSSQRLADRWDATTLRHVLTAAALGLLALPAVASALVGLLVLAVQGTALWLLVTAAALVTAALAAGGAAVALRRGHPGVVHRLTVLAGVWGVATIVAAVVLALVADAPDRVGVAVLLVLGGTYTLVVAVALWGAGRVLPAPADEQVDEHIDEEPAPPVRTGATPTVSEVPTPAAAPDDDTSADWPAWGGTPGTTSDDRPGDAAAADADATRVDLTRADVPGGEGPYVGPPYVRPPYARPQDDTTADVARDEPVTRTAPAADAPVTGSVPRDEPATGARGPATRPSAPQPATRTTSTPRTSTSAASAGASAARSAASRPAAATSRGGTSRTSGGTSRTSSSTGPRPPRRSVTSGGPRVGRTTSAGPATERIAPADGDEGPPTERLPPVER